MEFTIYSDVGENDLLDWGMAKTVCVTVVDNYPLDTLPLDSTPEYLFFMVIPWSMNADFDGLTGLTKSGLTFWTDTPTQTMAQIQSEITDAGIAYDYMLKSHYTLNGF